MSIEIRDTRASDHGDHGDPTVTDAELVRYLDGELDDLALESLHARLAASPAAGARLDTLRRRSAGLTAILAATDPAPAQLNARAEALRRRPSAPSAPLKAAAMIALLLVATFAVPPARAWVVDRVRDAAGALGLVTTTPPPDAAPVPVGADVAVTFAVAGETFEIHVPDAAGVLAVQRASGAVGSAEAERSPDAPDAPAATFVVLPAGLRIDGAATGAGYRVALPATVASVRIRAGDAPATTHPLPGAGETLRIELSPGAR